MKNIKNLFLIGGMAGLSLLNSGCNRDNIDNQEKRRIEDLNKTYQEMITLQKRYIELQDEYIKVDEAIIKNLDAQLKNNDLIYSTSKNIDSLKREKEKLIKMKNENPK